MAEARSTSASLKTALLVDLDQFEDDLTEAKVRASAPVSAIEKKMSDAAEKGVAKFALKLTAVVAAAKAVEKAVKSVVGRALELEKSGTGNSGTAAVARLTKAVDDALDSATRWALGLGPVKAAVDLLSDSLETTTGLLDAWRKGSIDAMDVLGFVGNALPGATFGSGGAGPSAVESIVAGEKRARRDAAADRAAEAAREAADKASDQAREMAARLEAQRAADAAAFGSAVDATVMSFVGSWESGFATLGRLFKDFAGYLENTIGGMTTGLSRGLGSVFESLAFTGPMLRDTFGQSEKAARRFAAAELALTGGVAVAKAAMEGAEALSSTAKGDGLGIAAHAAAAAAFAGAAGLAGVNAARTLAGGRGGAPSSTFATPASVAQERRGNTTIVIENFVGTRELARDLIPEINRSVGEGVVLISSHSGSTNRVDPGRFGP